LFNIISIFFGKEIEKREKKIPKESTKIENVAGSV
jgi:hypothetical protein